MACTSCLRKVAEAKRSLTEKSTNISLFVLALGLLIGAFSMIYNLLLTNSTGHSMSLNFLLREESVDNEHPKYGTVKRYLKASGKRAGAVMEV